MKCQEEKPFSLGYARKMSLPFINHSIIKDNGIMLVEIHDIPDIRVTIGRSAND